MDERRRGRNVKYIQLFILAAVVAGMMFFSLPSQYEIVSEDAIYTLNGLQGESEFVSLNLEWITVDMRGDIRIEWDLAFRLNGVAVDIDFGLFFYDEYDERSYISEHTKAVGENETALYIGVLSGHEIAPYPRTSLDCLINSLHAFVNMNFGDGTRYDVTYPFNVQIRYQLIDRR